MGNYSSWSYGFQLGGGPSPSLNDQLVEAAFEGDVEKITHLLDNGASAKYIDYEGRTALHSYIRVHDDGSVDIPMLLISRGRADVNQKDSMGRILLHMSSSKGNLSLTELLLMHGALVDLKNDDGATALFEAACQNNLKIVELLLRKSADPNITDTWGCSPLHDPCLKGNYEIVERLLKHGADPNKKDSVSGEYSYTLIDISILCVSYEY